MENVIELLNKNKIEYDLISHEEVHTIEDMDKLGILSMGCVCKNLFLRNANGKKNYVLSVPHDYLINLKELEKKIDSTRLSFGSSERLNKYLMLKPGYVTPFGFINDKEKAVIFVFDKNLINNERVGFHPNINTYTVFIKFNDLIKLIEEHGNEIIYI